MADVWTSICRLHLLLRTVIRVPVRENQRRTPLGDTLPNWVKESPPMRLDKIRAPLLLQPSLPAGRMEIYAGLQWMKKP